MQNVKIQMMKLVLICVMIVHTCYACSSIMYICATGKNVFDERGIHVWNTWGKIIQAPHYFIFASDEIRPKYPMIAASVGTDWASSQGKWISVILDERFDYDWYFLLDDDAFVVHQNVVNLITNRNPNEPILIGQMKCDYLCGGGGALISRTLVQELNSYRHRLSPIIPGYYDIILSHLIKDENLGVLEHNDDFHSQPPLAYKRDGVSINLKTPISFHYVNGKFQLEYYAPPGIYQQLYETYYV